MPCKMYTYVRSEEEAKHLCSDIAGVCLDIANELKSYYEYLMEASKIFQLIAEEGTDYSLLSQAADYINMQKYGLLGDLGLKDIMDM